MADDFFSSKNERLPRWFRAIRWGENWARIVNQKKRNFLLGWFPIFCFYILSDNLMAQEIWRLKPQSEDELNALRKKYMWDQNWRVHEIDQYRYDMKPHYDLWERRKHYPEHYGDRYDGYRRYESNQPLFTKNKPIYN